MLYPLNTQVCSQQPSNGMFLSPYQSILCNGLNPHLCKAGFQHVVLTPASWVQVLWVLDSICLKRNASSTFQSHFSNLFTSINGTTLALDTQNSETSTHWSSNDFNIYCVTSIVLGMENGNMHLTQSLGLRTREWRHCGGSIWQVWTGLRGGNAPNAWWGQWEKAARSMWSLRTCYRWEDFQRDARKSKQRRESGPTQDKRNSQELSGLEYLPHQAFCWGQLLLQASVNVSGICLCLSFLSSLFNPPLPHYYFDLAIDFLL